MAQIDLRHVDDLIDLISCKNKWNSWRETHYEYTLLIDCTDESVFQAISSCQWSEMNFSSTTFVNLSLVGKLLYKTSFENSDMRGSVFHNAQIKGANFRGANLSNGSIYLSEIRDCDFKSVNFTSAAIFRNFFLECKFDLSYFKDSNFQFSSFDKCTFVDANLARSDFRQTTLYKVDFSNADMMQAAFGRTSFYKTTLMGARNLIESKDCFQGIFHSDESLMSLNQLTEDSLPRKVLAGFGLSDTLIDYLPSFSNGSPINYNSCFISYSHQNEKFAKKLYERLRSEGVSVWYAPIDMVGGRKIPHQIDEAINIHDKLLLILSPESIESNWVKEEIYKAINKDGKPNTLYPISIFDNFNELKNWSFVDPDTGINVPRLVREYFIPNFSKWEEDDCFENEFSRLLKSLLDED